jgi:hypothetical protein
LCNLDKRLSSLYRSPGLYKQWTNHQVLPVATKLVVNPKKMRKICWELPVHQSYKLASTFRGECFFFKSSQSETRISHGDHVCFPIWTKMRRLYTEHSIRVSHQITINLAKWIYRRLFKLANHKQEMHMAAILVAWSARRISHTSFLQSNNSLSLLVSKKD